MKAQILKTTGEVWEVEPNNKTDFSLEELQEIVGGYIEIINFPNRECMVVNEEGVYMKLPINASATNLYIQKHNLLEISVIVGDVLICKSNQIL
jgi:hypothetical protein